MRGDFLPREFPRVFQGQRTVKRLILEFLSVILEPAGPRGHQASRQLVEQALVKNAPQYLFPVHCITIVLTSACLRVSASGLPSLVIPKAEHQKRPALVGDF
jgi:hypothetical protein